MLSHVLFLCRMEHIMERIYCILIGYAFGLFQTAIIYGKIVGVDIRKHGSGNAGTTNTLRVMGLKAGLIVLVGDLLKAILAVTLTGVLFGKSHPDMIYLLKMYTGLGVVLGHDFPFYLHFKGGKGIASTAGLMAAFHWSIIPMFVGVFLTIFFTTHFVSVGSLAIYTGFLIQVIIEGQMGLFGMPQAYLTEMYIVCACMTTLAYFQHRGNLVKLAHHNERKTYLFKKNEQ